MYISLCLFLSLRYLFLFLCLSFCSSVSLSICSSLSLSLSATLCMHLSQSLSCFCVICKRKSHFFCAMHDKIVHLQFLRLYYMSKKSWRSFSIYKGSRLLGQAVFAALMTELCLHFQCFVYYNSEQLIRQPYIGLSIRTQYYCLIQSCQSPLPRRMLQNH